MPDPVTLVCGKIVATVFSMAWIILIIAGLFEVGFTTCLAKAKETSGSTYLMWILGFFISMFMSMYLLYKATLTLPMGTAYAVWTGIGAAGTAIIGILFFKEPLHIWRLFFLFTLIASIVGLKYVTK
jgi:quaternary ammonium compound-resistance protein SugE